MNTTETPVSAQEGEAASTPAHGVGERPETSLAQAQRDDKLISYLISYLIEALGSAKAIELLNERIWELDEANDEAWEENPLSLDAEQRRDAKQFFYLLETIGTTTTLDELTQMKTGVARLNTLPAARKSELDRAFDDKATELDQAMASSDDHGRHP